jgi:ESF2/ABP1 family protein
MAEKVKADDIFGLEEADSDGSGYDSEEQRSTRKASTKKATKTAKKKNTAVFGLDQTGMSDGEDDYSSQDEDENEDEDTIAASKGSRFQLPSEGGPDKEDASKRVRGAKKAKKVKPLTPEELEKFQAARDKTGIVYLSKIPPFMKPVKLRHLLGAFGELGRVYLAPEGNPPFQDIFQSESFEIEGADQLAFSTSLNTYSRFNRSQGGSAS